MSYWNVTEFLASMERLGARHPKTFTPRVRLVLIVAAHKAVDGLYKAGLTVLSRATGVNVRDVRKAVRIGETHALLIATVSPGRYAGALRMLSQPGHSALVEPGHCALVDGEPGHSARPTRAKTHPNPGTVPYAKTLKESETRARAREPNRLTVDQESGMQRWRRKAETEGVAPSAPRVSAHDGAGDAEVVAPSAPRVVLPIEDVGATSAAAVPATPAELDARQGGEAKSRLPKPPPDWPQRYAQFDWRRPLLWKTTWGYPPDHHLPNQHTPELQRQWQAAHPEAMTRERRNGHGMTIAALH